MMADVTLEAHIEASGEVATAGARLMIQEMIVDRATAALLMARSKEPADLIHCPERQEAREVYHMVTAIIAGLAEAGVINFTRE
jgi:hypothetical protein